VIVALDSAAPDQSVAVSDRAGTVAGASSWTAPRGQGSELLPRLLTLLQAHALDLHAVEAVAVGLGPGSFTGLRVGLALAKGLAVGLQVPIVGIGSLAAWLEAEPQAVGALVRSGANEAWALGRGDHEPRLIGFEEIGTAVGERPLVAPRELAAALGLDRARPPDGAAAAIARLAATTLADGRADDLERLEPTYLRPPRGLGDAIPGAVTWL
jgi:tRNA threonylcarbamoyl adenosine modification protein YeaZ